MSKMSKKVKQVTIDKFFNKLPKNVLHQGLHENYFYFDPVKQNYDNMYLVKCFGVLLECSMSTPDYCILRIFARFSLAEHICD